ncbi:MAG: hypothetical protein QM767_10315 [Anaeromyxobacter sp.]
MLMPELIRFLWAFILACVALMIFPFSDTGILAGFPRLLRVAQSLRWVFPILSVILFVVAGRLDGRRTDRLLASGRSAPATVLEVRDRGISIGESPVLTVKLRVMPEGAAPFEAEVAFVPSRVTMGIVQAGAAATVRYDPADPGTIAVESVMVSSH